MTNLPPLTAREYKLLLDPDGFASTKRGAANAWLEKSLRPVLEPVRCRGAFDETKTRKVRFFDTAKGLLNSRGYVLRERTDADGKGRPEVTLKLRTPDFFVSGLTPMDATGTVTQVKLEEDIAPIEVLTGAGAKAVRFAKPPGVYSRYSQSTKVEADRTPQTLRDVFAAFINLSADLDDPGIDDREVLARGPGIDEIVHGGPAIEIAPNVNAELCLTFWRIRKTGTAIAEVSFKYDIGERVEPAIGRMALSLFLSMCSGLAVERRFLSKTAKALPKK